MASSSSTRSRTSLRQRDGRPAHHPAGQARIGRCPASRRSTTRPTSIKLAGRACAARPGRTSSASSRPRDAALDSVTRLAIGAGHRRSARRRHPARHALPDDHARAPSSPTVGSFRDSMRDDTGVVFASAFPAATTLRRGSRSPSTADRARRDELAALRGCHAPELGDGRAGWPPSWTGASHELDLHGDRARSSSTASSSSARCRWATRSSPSSSAPEGRTRRSTRRAPARRRRSRWPRTGSAPAAADARDRGRRRRRHLRRPAALGRCRASWPPAPLPPTTSVEDAATPFDRRRHGMIARDGRGGVRRRIAPPPPRERGIQPICEVLGTATANSAFHGTRLDVEHIGQVMEQRRHPGRVRAVSTVHAIAARDDVRLARDVHAGPRRQRRRRDPRAAPGVRRRGRPDRHRQHQGLHRPRRWAPASRTSSRSRRSRPGSCRQCPTSRRPTPSWAS